jgi:hypothetical protein
LLILVLILILALRRPGNKKYGSRREGCTKSMTGSEPSR